MRTRASVGVDDTAPVTSYVDATAALLDMPLDAERRTAVIAAMTRLAEFAADVTAVELAGEVETAGVFVP